MFLWKNAVAVVAIIMLGILPGCGGGGSSDSSSPAPLPNPSPLPTKTLSWSPPTAYTDGTPMNPVTELLNFEIYVKQGGQFTSTDTPMALVGAVNPSTGQLVTNFDLSNLAPYINLGVQYQVALKAVAITGSKSDFSAAATFSF